MPRPVALKLVNAVVPPTAPRLIVLPVLVVPLVNASVCAPLIVPMLIVPDVVAPVVVIVVAPASVAPPVTLKLPAVAILEVGPPVRYVPVNERLLAPTE